MPRAAWTLPGRRLNPAEDQRKAAAVACDGARGKDDDEVRADAALLLEALGLVRFDARGLKSCGTPAAYERHRKNGDPDCRVCLDAMAERNRKNYAADPDHARELARDRVRRYHARQKNKAATVALDPPIHDRIPAEGATK